MLSDLVPSSHSKASLWTTPAWQGNDPSASVHTSTRTPAQWYHPDPDWCYANSWIQLTPPPHWYPPISAGMIQVVVSWVHFITELCDWCSQSWHRLCLSSCRPYRFICASQRERAQAREQPSAAGGASTGFLLFWSCFEITSCFHPTAIFTIFKFRNKPFSAFK